jgi:hypothetical protein
MMRSNISKLAVRKFSTALTKETARESVAKNILLYQAVRQAESAEELKAILNTPLPALDAATVEAFGLKSYINRSFSGSTTKFVKDPTAWQNLPVGELIVAEASRAETWPFFLGFAITLGLSFMAMGSFSKEDEKSSRYMQLMERARGNAHDDHHGHH